MAQRQWLKGNGSNGKIKTDQKTRGNAIRIDKDETREVGMIVARAMIAAWIRISERRYAAMMLLCKGYGNDGVGAH